MLYFITELDIGGAQKVLVHILKHLDRRRFSPLVACLYNENGIIANQIRALNVPVIGLRMTAKWRVDALWRFYRLLRREQPVILHSSLFHANIPSRIIGGLAGVPIKVSWRQNLEIGGQLREFINRQTVRLDHKVVAVCELARQAEIKRAGLSPDKVVTIYNCIDACELATNASTRAKVRQEFGIPARAPLIGTVGRLHPQKGLSTLLAAMTDLKTHIPTVRWLVVGDGELREELEQQTDAYGLSDSVIFAGARSDVPQILAALDLFALPSLWEGLPLAALEAMAAGLPVIATTVGGVPEVVVNEVTGLLVPPNNPAALAQALRQVLANPAQRQAMGAAGQEQVAKKFSVSSIIPQIEALYEALLLQQLQLRYEPEKGWLST